MVQSVKAIFDVYETFRSVRARFDTEAVCCGIQLQCLYVFPTHSVDVYVSFRIAHFKGCLRLV